jgi:hypothetical protein
MSFELSIFGDNFHLIAAGFPDKYYSDFLRIEFTKYGREPQPDQKPVIIVFIQGRM